MRGMVVLQQVRTQAFALRANARVVQHVMADIDEPAREGHYCGDRQPEREEIWKYSPAQPRDGRADDEHRKHIAHRARRTGRESEGAEADQSHRHNCDRTALCPTKRGAARAGRGRAARWRTRDLIPQSHVGSLACSPDPTPPQRSSGLASPPGSMRTLDTRL